MGSAFSTKTIFQFVAALDSAFALVICAFGIKTLVLYQKYLNGESGADPVGTTPTPDATIPSDPYAPYVENQRNYIQYAAIFAIAGSIIQLLAAYLLVAKSRYSAEKFGNDIHPGPVPIVWIIHSVLQFAVHVAVSLGPTLMYDMTKEPEPMQKALKEFFTYSWVSAVFKFLFIWGVASKIGGSKGRSHDGPLCSNEETERYKEEAKY